MEEEEEEEGPPSETEGRSVAGHNASPCERWAAQIYVEGCGEDEAFEAAVDAEADDVVPVPADEDGTPSTSYRVRARVRWVHAARLCLLAFGAEACDPRRART